MGKGRCGEAKGSDAWSHIIGALDVNCRRHCTYVAMLVSVWYLDDNYYLAEDTMLGIRCYDFPKLYSSKVEFFFQTNRFVIEQALISLTM